MILMCVYEGKKNRKITWIYVQIFSKMYLIIPRVVFTECNSTDDKDTKNYSIIMLCVKISSINVLNNLYNLLRTSAARLITQEIFYNLLKCNS